MSVTQFSVLSPSLAYKLCSSPSLPAGEGTILLQPISWDGFWFTLLWIFWIRDERKGRNSSETGGIRKSAATGRSHTGSLRFHFMALTPTSTATSSDFWLKNKTDFSAKQPLSWDINTAGIQIDHTQIQTAAGQLWLISFLPLQVGDKTGGRQAHHEGRRRDRCTTKLCPSSWEDFDFPSFWMLRSHESQQVPWGSAYRKSRPQAPLTSCRIEGEPPTPYHGSQAHLTLFPTSANPLFLFESSQIPYCPHGCGALHPVQAEGMQQGERGRYKQEQKQPRVSGRGMKERASWDTTYNHSDTTERQGWDGGLVWSPRHMQRERTPARGPLMMSSLAQEGELWPWQLI